MVILIPEDVNPIRIAYLSLKYSGAMNQKGRPWSLILPISHVILLNYFGVTAVMEILFGNGNLTEIVQAISAIAVFIQVNAKNINLLWHESQVRSFLTRLERLRTEISQDDEVADRLIMEAENLAKKVILIFNAIYHSFPFISLLNNFMVDYFTDFQKPHLTHQLWIPWDMRTFWPYMAGTTIITITTISTVIYHTTFGTLQLAFTFEMSAFLKILQHRLKTNGPRDRSVYEHYKVIMKLIKDYNDLFSGQMYLEVLVSSIQPCGFGYALIKVLKRYDGGAPDLAYKFFVTICTPVFNCSCGQEVSTQVEKLHEYAYMNNWYEETPAVRKNLLQLMTVTVNPMEVNYRKLISFNYVCFARIAQGIYTYLAMIVNFETD